MFILIEHSRKHSKTFRAERNWNLRVQFESIEDIDDEYLKICCIFALLEEEFRRLKETNYIYEFQKKVLYKVKRKLVILMIQIV